MQRDSKRTTTRWRAVYTTITLISVTLFIFYFAVITYKQHKAESEKAGRTGTFARQDVLLLKYDDYVSDPNEFERISVGEDFFELPVSQTPVNRTMVGDWPKFSFSNNVEVTIMGKAVTEARPELFYPDEILTINPALRADAKNSLYRWWTKALAPPSERSDHNASAKGYTYDEEQDLLDSTRELSYMMRDVTLYESDFSKGLISTWSSKTATVTVLSPDEQYAQVIGFKSEKPGDYELLLKQILATFRFAEEESTDTEM